MPVATTTAAPKKRRAAKKASLPVWALPPSIPRTPTSSTPELEAVISRLLLLRYEHDIARLFSTHIHYVAYTHVPKLMARITLAAGSPGWCAANGGQDVVKDFYRSVLAMDLRQAGERVAPRSLEWSYTSLRHFAISQDVHICKTGDHGLQPFRLLPFLPYLQSYVKALETLPPPSFTPLTHLSNLSPKSIQDRIRKQSSLKETSANIPQAPQTGDWDEKVERGYERLVDTLWDVAREFDVRGYGMVLKQKLRNWCDCGCSTEHLGEVCERTVRDDEIARQGVKPKGSSAAGGCGEPHKREKGKGREWDGRGGGVWGWGTKSEEDVWEKSLDLGGCDDSDDWEEQMTMGEQMEWRYLKAEREKERGNVAFKEGRYTNAIAHYIAADGIEPELPHYRLNAAQAYLQLGRWADAERACTISLRQHRCSVKGLWRRSKARKMLGKHQAAAKDLRALLKVQPSNREALAELHSLYPPRPPPYASQPSSTSSCAASCSYSFSTSSPSPSGSRSGAGSPNPPDLDEGERRKLNVACVPVTLTMPDTNRSESFSYPSWERYRVERVI